MADCAHMGPAPLDVDLRTGGPLPTHYSTKFLSLRGSDGVGVLWYGSMGISASSPLGGVTPHSAHQMAPGGVVAHSSPPAGVVAHWSPPELSPQLFPFFLHGRNLRQRTACG